MGLTYEGYMPFQNKKLPSGTGKGGLLLGFPTPRKEGGSGKSLLHYFPIEQKRGGGGKLKGEGPRKRFGILRN